MTPVTPEPVQIDPDPAPDPAPVKSVEAILADSLDLPVARKGDDPTSYQTIRNVIDGALEQVNPNELKRLVEIRMKELTTESAAAITPIIQALVPVSGVAEIQAYLNDGAASDQWHDALSAANIALARWISGKSNEDDKADPATFWPAYLKAVLDLHKSARKVVPSLEVV